jgi:hypothetical protein
MELLGLPLALCLGGLGLLAALGVGAVVLLKLGVIAQYAFKEEPPNDGSYSLDQSHEAKEE